jgi:peptide deformylase
MGEVDRHEQITVKGLNRHGKPVKYKLNGWLARIFQHEIDHLEGVLFIDHVTDPEKIRKVTAKDADKHNPEVTEALALLEEEPVPAG